jgi:predicted HTH domain antitoxin
MELHRIAHYRGCMTITLPDDPALLHLDEKQLRIDIACSLFAAGRISRGVAARIAGLDSLVFDEELFRRKIPSYTSEMLDQDLAAWRGMSEA